MKQTHAPIDPKATYTIPTLEIIEFSYEDILTTSGKGDENQGEWDPQRF